MRRFCRRKDLRESKVSRWLSPLYNYVAKFKKLVIRRVRVSRGSLSLSLLLPPPSVNYVSQLVAIINATEVFPDQLVPGTSVFSSFTEIFPSHP